MQGQQNVKMIMTDVGGRWKKQYFVTNKPAVAFPITGMSLAVRQVVKNGKEENWK
jgi:hypothetical protein